MAKRTNTASVHRAQRKKEKHARRRKLRAQEIPVFEGTPAGGPLFRPATIWLPAPSRFSFVGDPSGCIEYFERVGRSVTLGPTGIDLSAIEDITTDAIAVMLAHISDAAFSRNTVWGNFPRNPELCKFVDESAMLDHVSSAGGRRLGGGSAGGGLLQTMFETRVAPGIASEAVHRASVMAFGTRLRMPGCYRVIIECMANTHNHASLRTMGSERWWLAVGRVRNTERVAFAFVDRGVGLFEHAKVQSIIGAMAQQYVDGRAETYVPALTRIDALKAMLEGKVESRTGLRYRGKGLPAIYQALQKRQISGLTIVANDVFARLDEGAYSILPKPFQGTLVYWEVGRDNSGTLIGAGASDA